MTKKEISIDVFELKLSKKYSDENKKLNDLFDAEMKNSGDYSASIPQTYKSGDFSYNTNGYYIGTLINSKYYNLPLVSNASKKIATELPLGADESLGYATSFIYDTYTQIIMIERIQNGVTTERLFEYFKRCHKLPDKIRFVNVYDPKILENYKSMKSIKSFKIKIAKVTNGNIFSTQDKSISQVVSASTDTNADELIIELKSKGKGNQLTLSKIQSLVKNLLGFNSDGLKQVEKLEFIAKDGNNINIKPFDLISEIMGRKIIVEYTRHVNELAIKSRIFELEKLFLEERDGLLSAYDKRVKE
jgi:hypothetical protein